MKSINSTIDLGITSSSRVLVFMPHPDDEAVFISGLLQKISRTNPNIKVITVTAGEKSTLRFGLTPNQDLATVRKAELNAALSILGISDHETWDFPDGGIEYNSASVQSKITKEIAHYQPTHLVTFEPDGIYGHPDHIAVSEAVTKSCPAATKLLYITVSPRYIFPKAKKLAKKTSIKPLKPTYKMKLHLQESINKIKACRAHHTQFKFNLFHPKTIIHFLLNDMLFHEYYIYQAKKG